MSEETSSVPASVSTGTVEEAASKIEALLSGKKPEKQRAAPPEETAISSATSEDAADTEEPETETTASNASEDASDDEAPEPQPDAEDDAESDDQPEPLYTVKINGKEEQVSLKEALSGYQRQQDYTRAKQAFAEEKRQFVADLENARQQSEVYAQLLPAMVQRLQASLPAAPDPSLIDVNPSAYLRQKEAYEQALGDLQAAASEQSRMSEQSQVEQQRKLHAYVAENAAKLPELVPEWKDQKVYERDRHKVRDYLSWRGFSDDEINQAYDARLVAMAADATKWRELQKGKIKPVAPAPERGLKPTPPASKPPAINRDAQAARNRLAKSGRVEDAAAAIRALL